MISLSRVGWALSFLILALVLCIPTFYNQFPLLYYDSGYYFQLAVFPYSPETHFWRPLTYSYFLRICFWISKSLVLPIFVQNTLILGLIFAFLKTMIGPLQKKDYAALIFILLCSSYVNFVNFIGPDIFAGLIPICLAGILIKKKWSPTFVSGLLVSVAMHFTNIFIGSVSAILFAGRMAKRRLAMVLLILLLPIGLISFTNYWQSEKFFVSNVAHWFLFSKLVGVGIGEKFLQENCEVRELAICKDRDLGFNIWEIGPNSQIGKFGGYAAMDKVIKEANYEILKSRFIWDYIVSGLRGTWAQFIYIAETMPPIFDNAGLRREIDAVSLQLADWYDHQPIYQLDLYPVYIFHGWLELVLILVSLAVIGAAFYRRVMNSNVKTAFYVLLVVYILNAFICGFFTEPMARYSDRFLWVLPLLAWCHFRGTASGNGQPSTAAKSVS